MAHAVGTDEQVPSGDNRPDHPRRRRFDHTKRHGDWDME
jgi:hypothetical protein